MIQTLTKQRTIGNQFWVANMVKSFLTRQPVAISRPCSRNTEANLWSGIWQHLAASQKAPGRTGIAIVFRHHLLAPANH